MFSELRQLVEYLWVLGAPALGARTDGVLIGLGLGLAVVLVAALLAVLLSFGAPPQAIGITGRTCRGTFPRSRSGPPGVGQRFDARPRAPGGALV